MATDTVQLELPTANTYDAKKVIAAEMAQVRKSTSSLPKLAQRAQSLSKLAEQMEGPPRGSGGGLPHVSGGMKEKFDAARRGAMLMSTLGSAGLEKMLAKEDQEKKRRKQRMAAMNGDKDKDKQSQQGTSPRTTDRARRGSKPGNNNGAPAQQGSLTARSLNSLSQLPQLMRGASGRSGGGGCASGRRRTSRTGIGSRRSSRRSGAGDVGYFDEDDIVRGDSRIGELLKEFGSREDWVTATILKHQLASVIQANIRGWLTRLRWRVDKPKLVEDLHTQMADEDSAAERKARLRKQLELRSMTTRQKAKAANVVTKLFGAKAVRGASGSGAAPKSEGGGSKWGKLHRNLDIAAHDAAVEEVAAQVVAEGGDADLVDPLASLSGSDFSDLEMEDIAAVKLRARTPPWQRVEQSQWVGQYAKLTNKSVMGNLEVLWDLGACDERLGGVRGRRLARHPGGEDAQLGGMNGAFDPTTQSLPPKVIEDLLYPKYIARYARMGLLPQNPLARPEDDEVWAALQAAGSSGTAAAAPAQPPAVAAVAEDRPATAAAATAPLGRSASGSNSAQQPVQTPSTSGVPPGAVAAAGTQGSAAAVSGGTSGSGVADAGGAAGGAGEGAKPG